MRVERELARLGGAPRAVAIGTFDGVHLGHRQLLAAAVAAGLLPTVVTFDPHPRLALGYGVELLTSLERRLELVAEAGIAEALVVEFDLEFAQLEPEAFVDAFLRPLGTEVVVAGADFRFGHDRSGDLALLRGLGFDVRTVPLVEGVSSSRIRDLLRAGEIERATHLLGRAPEIEGTVVAGDARGGTLGFPTANLRVDPQMVVPAHGIYAGAADGHRAAISIGTNPHYGGEERRVEAFLLDFSGDLYGRKLMLQLWQRLRDEAAFASEAELIAQIARDVEQTRAARPPLEVDRQQEGAETGG
ncbi:MAG TPA: riboflavin biosynthesis protein RibF [Gaiellaceae bacterium]|nr:riboflavin biosynthesis protein RibF [Gaiellaceae bacterium]